MAKVPILMSAQLTNLPVIRKPIHFVNEDLKLDALVDLVGPSHRLMQADEGFPVVILQDTTTQSLSRLDKSETTHLSINHKYQSPTATKDVLRVKCRIKEVDLSRKVPDLKRRCC